MSDQITILYVDDEAMNLFVFKANFDDKYNVITSTSPLEALEQLTKYSDDIILVISDMKMPQMDGVEFITTAKAKFPNISYCLLTGFDNNETIQDAIDQGIIQNFLTKPFDADEVEEIILEESKKRRA